MGEMDIGKADYGDMTNAVTDYSVSPKDTDGATGDDETFYINQNWSKQLGYYKAIPELKQAIDTKARWVIGSGYTSNEITTQTLMAIKGYGNDTFNSILENGLRVYQIGEDFYAEIIRDNDSKLINLKPLDTGSIKKVTNSKGIIRRYEQISKVKGQESKKFQPNEIFNLCRDRVADEIHGNSVIDAVEEIILSRNEAMKDMRVLMHRYVKPIIKWQLDTDNATKIAEFKIKADKATENGENLFIPQGAVEADILSVPANATLNPLPWINQLNNYFYQAVGVPQILVGGSSEMTEATTKVAMIAFQEGIKEEQLFVKEQVLSQLNLEIDFQQSAVIQNDLISDSAKDGQEQLMAPEDATLTEGMK